MSQSKAIVLIDMYHHRPPANWLTDHAVMGMLSNNLGRYSLNDNYHTNGYFNLAPTLGNVCDFREHNAPLTREALANCDILLVVNPDYHEYKLPTPGPAFDDREIAAIHEFIDRGGRMLMMLNSFLPRDGDYLWKENYDIVSCNRLLARYGIACGRHVSRDEEVCPIAKDDPLFGGLNPVCLGHGGQLHLTKIRGVTHHVHFGNEGRLYCVTAERSAGRIVVLADAGFISNGLYVDNRYGNLAFGRRMFEVLRPSWLDNNDDYNYEVVDFSYVGYPILMQDPDATPLGTNAFAELNSDAPCRADYNYRYQTAERRKFSGSDALALPADPLRLAENRCRIVNVEALGCELFASTADLEMPIEVLHVNRLGELIEIHCVGCAEQPVGTLADRCQTKIPAFDVKVVSALQTLSWKLRLNERTGRIISSLCRMYVEPIWKNADKQHGSVSLGRTQLVLPSLKSEDLLPIDDVDEPLSATATSTS